MPPLPALAGLGLVAAPFLGACAMNTRPSSPSVMTAAGVTMPADRLDINVTETAARIASLIISGADSIVRATPEPAARHTARVWRIEGTQAAHDAAFRFDPLVSALDLYAFAVQQDEYFTRGNGRAVIGSAQPVATTTTGAIRTSMRLILDSILPAERVAAVTATVERWAGEHPITELTGRPSIEMYSTRLLGADETSAFASLGDIQQSARRINRRLALLQQQLATQVRWQAELAVADAIPAGTADTLLVSLSRVSLAADRLAGTAEALPPLVTGEREAVLAALTRERIATLAALSAERVALLEALTREREAVLAALDAQRALAMQDVERVGDRLVARLSAEAATLADRLVARVALLIVLPLALGLVALALVVLVVFRPRSPASSGPVS